VMTVSFALSPMTNSTLSAWGPPPWEGGVKAAPGARGRAHRIDHVGDQVGQG